MIKSQLRVLKSQYEELQQVIAAVDQTVEPRAVTRFLNQAGLDLAKSMQELAPEDGYVLAAVANTEELQRELQNEVIEGRVYRIRESDSQIALTQSQLDKAATVLTQQHSTGAISPEELNTYKRHLMWAHLMLPTLSYVAQGHQAISRSEYLPAKAFYQKAKVAVNNSNHPDPRRAQMVTELTEIIERQRRSLSKEIMVETNFNPPPLVESDNTVDDQTEGTQSSSKSASNKKKKESVSKKAP
ncbi:hypothetical protein [Halioxenophilus aromaticivorans]|uniref:Uncharacterized protein n=1 Tax=Halioxenophilus aromaticivorans TaxID=1306992 RepID=A0AAV3TXK2_9ALTE